MIRHYIQLTAVAGAVLFGASVSHAQTGNASDNGNATPAAILSGFYSGGTVAVATNVQVANAITAVMSTITALSSSGSLTSTVPGQTISTATAVEIVQLLTSASDQVKADATAEFSSGGASPEAVNTLLSELPSLLSNPRPGQAQAAVAQFNRIVQDSSIAFLTNPPKLFVALQAVLAQISAAANAAQ